MENIQAKISIFLMGLFMFSSIYGDSCVTGCGTDGVVQDYCSCNGPISDCECSCALCLGGCIVSCMVLPTNQSGCTDATCCVWNSCDNDQYCTDQCSAWNPAPTCHNTPGPNANNPDICPPDGSGGTSGGGSPPPPPPPPNCGAGIVCGTVKTIENNVALQSAVIELYNSSGKVIQTGTTDATGKYSFTGLTDGSIYYVQPALGRMQHASPDMVKVKSPGTIGAADFAIGGVRANLTVLGQAGALVSVTPFAYSGAFPSQKNSYSSSIDSSGKTVLSVPGGSSYWLVCWSMDDTHQFHRHSDVGSTPFNSGNIVNPQDQIAMSCP